MKYLSINRSDGGVTVRVIPAAEDDHDFDAEIAQWLTRPRVIHNGWTVVSWAVSDTDPRPSDRTFREAFKVVGDRVEIDIPKARAIHMDRIREARNVELNQLDKDWMKETGRGRKPQADAIEVRREELRNIPQTFDLNSANTPEELNQLWPPGLERL